MNYRDFLQKAIYRIINPLIKGMIKVGITPNFITTTGFLLNIVAAGIFVYAAAYKPENSLALIGWGGFIILFAGLFDMMDGRLARMGNMSSTFGALWDSTLDRYSELFTLFGIALYFLLSGWIGSGVITFLAIGIECKVGFMQRPERVVVTSIGAIFCGIYANLWVLSVPMMLIAVLANITAFWRVWHCYKQLKGR